MALAALAAWAGSTARSGDARAGTAARALTMGALFCSVSLGLLLDALRRGDLTVDFVARHTTLALPMMVRLLAVGADASGAGLLAATVALAAGAWACRRADAPGTAAAVGVTALVLLAAPLAGRPHALLPWLPVDGQDPLPAFRERLAWPWVLAVAGAVAAAAVTLGRALDAWRGDADPSRARVAAMLAPLLVAVQGMTGLQVALASGASRDLSPLVARGGAWSLSLAVSLVALVLVPSAAAPQRARVVAAVAQVLATVGLVLATVGLPVTVAVRALLLLSIVASVGAAWEGRAAIEWAVHALSARTRERRLGALLASGALAVALLAAGAGTLASTRTVTLASGGAIPVGGGRLDHLGISRYDLDDATVLALALERRGGTRTVLSSAEHREYTDSRGAVLGALVRVPARFTGAVSTVAWLERVADDEGAELTIASRPDWLAWWVALALFGLHVAFMLATVEPARR